jgi:hypothetical protein
VALWEWGGDPQWSFVVDTDQYAGNFERELGAYVIGAVDDHGDESVAHYLEKFDGATPPSKKLTQLSDMRIADPGDDGIHRSPVDLAPTPGWSNDGHGNAYRVKGNGKYRFKYPSYQSVAIFLVRKPIEEETALLTKRAQEFEHLTRRKAWGSQPKILGCRLVEEHVLLNTHQVWERP